MVNILVQLNKHDNKFENLFSMLEGNRFNCFLRGANEAISDLARVNDPSLTIEPTLAFVYPSASLFFVNKNEGCCAMQDLSIGGGMGECKPPPWWALPPLPQTPREGLLLDGSTTQKAIKSHSIAH